MGPDARDKPNDNIVDYPDDDDSGIDSERTPSPQIRLNADRYIPTARQQARSALTENDITGSIKRRVIKKVIVQMGSGITQINKLNDTNWVNWREDMMRMLNFLSVKDYLLGNVPRPDPDHDPEEAKAWDYNDSYALHLVSLNLTEGQKIHISRKETSHGAWIALQDIHEAQDHDTITSWMKSLFQTTAEEGSDIPKHVNKLLEWYEKIILANDPDFQLSDTMFKSIITNSLPPSWHTFTKPYVRRRTGIPNIDYETRITASKLIGIINEEYDRQQSKLPIMVNTMKFKPKGIPKPTLKQRISNPPLSKRIKFRSKWCA